jgi:hypothetical protein
MGAKISAYTLLANIHLHKVFPITSTVSQSTRLNAASSTTVISLAFTHFLFHTSGQIGSCVEPHI